MKEVLTPELLTALAGLIIAVTGLLGGLAAAVGLVIREFRKIRDELKTDIKENTEISVAAVQVGVEAKEEAALGRKEANGYNEKIADNAKRIVEGGEKMATLVALFHQERAGAKSAAVVSNSRLDKLEEAPIGDAASTLERVDETTQQTLKEVQKQADP